MGSSARTIVTRTLQLLNVYGAEETPSDADLQFGFVSLNRLVSKLGTQRATIYAVQRAAYPLTAGVASYTIGPGGDFSPVRPLWIEGFGVIPDRGAAPLVELPFGRPLSLDEFRRFAIPSTPSSFPTAIYYDHGFTGVGLGRIHVFPVPNVSSVDLVLYTPQALVQFATVDTVYEFPPGYEEMLEHNLARPLAPAFSTSVSEEVREIARESLADIKRANNRPKLARFPRALVGRGGYDIYSDSRIR